MSIEHAAQRGVEKLPDQKVVIEVGAEHVRNVAHFFPKTLVDDQGNQAMYIPVNIRLKPLQALQSRTSQRLLSVAADLAQLPFKAGLADEIWVTNVLGSPEFSGGDHKLFTPGVILGTLSDCVTALKEKGKLIIAETITPGVTRNLKSISESEWNSIGLHLEKLHVGEDALEYWEGLGYKIPDKKILLQRGKNRSPFFLILTEIHA